MPRHSYYGWSVWVFTWFKRSVVVVVLSDVYDVSVKYLRVCGRVSGISCCAGVGKCLPGLVSMAVRKQKGDGGPICQS